jgi:two-component system chemotaxis sensor kinase CheA
MSVPDDDIVASFREEANDRIDRIDAALLAVEAGSADAGVIDELFRQAHTIKGTASLLGRDDVSRLAHRFEDVLAGVRDSGDFPPGLATSLLRASRAMRGLVNGAGDQVDAGIAETDMGSASGQADPGPGQPGTGDRDGPDRARPWPAAAPDEPARAGQRDRGHQGAEPVPPQRAPRPDPETGRGLPDGRGTTGVSGGPGGRGSVRVPADRLDHLLDLVGEFMQYRRHLMHVLATAPEEGRETFSLLDPGGRLLAELRDVAVGMRTMPLSVITGPLPRAVRDLARAAGKEVEFAAVGTGTQLDRAILESLTEPVTHLLRNAIEHGIELPGDRRAAGKPLRGRVELRAAPRGGMVEVTVADDGRGVPAEALSLVASGGSLTDVLTRPGFSTADRVTDLGGRGVGLDAVRAYARSLGGGLEIHSEPGAGTSVSLLLPLALALMTVLLVEHGGAVYGVPVSAVAEVVSVDRLLRVTGRPSVRIRERILPLVDLGDLVGAPAAAYAEGLPAIVLGGGDRPLAVSCDALLGQAEVVVKPLSRLAGGESYLGAAILGDGRIALILDPGGLIAAYPAVRAANRVPVALADRSGRDGATVLLVEDSPAVIGVQRKVLREAGYQVTTARDGEQALEVLRRGGISAVVTDLQMPRLDGFGLTRAIRADPLSADLPIIVVTTHAREQDRQMALAAGANALLAKQSLDGRALVRTIEQLRGR